VAAGDKSPANISTFLVSTPLSMASTMASCSQPEFPHMRRPPSSMEDPCHFGIQRTDHVTLMHVV
jgi:hypothetical protein